MQLQPSFHHFLKTLKYDLIIAGYQAIDGDTAQVGPQVAELLSIPQVTYLQEIVEVVDKSIIVKKRTTSKMLTLKVTMPCLITTLSDMNKPRYMNAMDIFNSTDKEVNIVTLVDLVVDETKIGLKGSPTWVKKTFVKPVMQKICETSLFARGSGKTDCTKNLPLYRGES